MRFTTSGYHIRLETGYHLDEECPLGRAIPAELLHGSGDYRLCPTCRCRLDARQIRAEP